MQNDYERAREERIRKNKEQLALLTAGLTFAPVRPAGSSLRSCQQR
jgi:hypothetical protein